jgi:putative hemolysin
MMKLLVAIRLCPFRLSSFGGVFRSLPILALAACAALGLTISASAKEAKGFAQATLVEAADYIPCGDGCSTHAAPASAFCFRQGGQVLLGEGKSYLHEGKFSPMKELAGTQVQIRYNRRYLWIKPPDGTVEKIERGSQFESFRDAGCVRAVRAPILAGAYAHKRPGKVPADAFVLAGSGKGELYLWYHCDPDAGASVIACRKWYRNGDFFGKDWYCAQTMEGAPVGSVAALDPLLSQEGRLVLKTGAVVRPDHRARTNDLLDRPNEACR